MKTNSSPQIKYYKYSIIRYIFLKEKRKVNGNLTRRPPARLIALNKVFKVSVKPFQRLAECEAEPHEKSLGRVRGGSPGKGLAECEAEPHEKAALAGRGAAAPERSLKKIYLNKGNV